MTRLCVVGLCCAVWLASVLAAEEAQVSTETPPARKGDFRKGDFGGKEIISAAATLGAYALDRAVEYRWDIYSTVTGNEIPESLQKPATDGAQALLKEKIADAAIGGAVRSVWETVWLPLAVLGVCMLAGFVYQRYTRTYKEKHF